MTTHSTGSSRGTPATSGDHTVAVGGDNIGTIDTGLMLNIHGDDAERNRDIARTGLTATLRAPSREPKHRKGVARNRRDSANTLADKLSESYTVESFGQQFMHLPAHKRDAKFAVLGETADYFRAAARSLPLIRESYDGTAYPARVGRNNRRALRRMLIQQDGVANLLPTPHGFFCQNTIAARFVL